LDRNQVIVDGTKPGSSPCDSSPDAQDLGPLDGDGHPSGRNGIEVFEVDGVSVENLTACNFLTGAHGGGNQIWWNGGDGTGTVNSALGYSGTNSGGHLIVEKSEWDENTCGIVTNSQNNDDAPSPQDGACPGGGRGPTGSHSCTLFRKNHVHDNNNPNVPRSGT